MQYFALLISQERELTPEERAPVMTAYENFNAKAGPAIRAGDALLPMATGVRITGGPDAPVVTDGPFAEAAEVACGYYVFEAENLDEALNLAHDIHAAQHGAAFATDEHLRAFVGEMPLVAVGVTDGERGDARPARRDERADEAGGIELNRF